MQLTIRFGAEEEQSVHAIRLHRFTSYHSTVTNWEMPLSGQEGDRCPAARTAGGSFSPLKPPPRRELWDPKAPGTLHWVRITS